MQTTMFCYHRLISHRLHNRLKMLRILVLNCNLCNKSSSYLNIFVSCRSTVGEDFSNMDERLCLTWQKAVNIGQDIGTQCSLSSFLIENNEIETKQRQSAQMDLSPVPSLRLISEIDG